MTTRTKLAAHPRLYASATELDRLRHTPRTPLLRAAAEAVARQADRYVHSPDFEWVRNTHNAHLGRARAMQHRVMTLLVRWLQTGQRRFRDSAVAHIAQMGEWEYWSWITWRQGDPSPEAIFDLSYGENSMTLAICYDWLCDTLCDDERALFLRIARDRALRPFLVHTSPKRRAWWYGSPNSNWNTVCAGGAGMLALAMYEDLAEARRALPRCERSVAPFMLHLDQTHGGWPEGIGYWNYGMSYAFRYLLSHEHATGRKHPLMQRPGTRATLAFPLDFCPNGVPCSFGDVNHWAPRPFHLAAAARLGRADVLSRLDARLTREQATGDGAAELLVLHPRRRQRAPAAAKHVVKVYRGLDWGVLADRLPRPSLYLAIRGGTTRVPHGHRDLMSFHCVIKDEALISNLAPVEYLDTTFSPRRWELFEMSPASKNMIFINGCGITGDSAVAMRTLDGDGVHGIRIDATNAMGAMRDGAAARFCGRLFLMLKGKVCLSVDRVELEQFGRTESRMHTFATVQTGGHGALLRGKRASLRIAYAGDVPAALHTAIDAPTTPGQGATLLRWCTQDLHRTATLVALLSPGRAAARVDLAEQHGRLLITATANGWTTRVRLTKRLLRPTITGSAAS